MIIDSPIVSGSYAASGSVNQFGNVVISGSLTVTGSIIGTASLATTASYALTASYAANVPVTASYAISASQATTASYLSGYVSPFPYTGSAIISGSLGVTGSLKVTNLSGSGVRYLVTDESGSVTAQTASAVIKTTQAFTATSGQTTFAVTNGYSTGYVDVFINGSKLNSTEFTDTSGTNVVLATGSFANDIVEVVKYLPASGVSNNVLRQQTVFTASAGQTVFSASYTPGLLDIFLNGSKLAPDDYTANNGTTFTLVTASAANDILDVFVYSYQVGSFSGIGGVGTANQLAYFGTTNSITGSPNFTVSGSAIVITGSLIVSSSSTFTNIGPTVLSGSVGVSGSLAVGGVSVVLVNQTSSLSVSTASFAATASSADNFLTRGTITAQTLVVQTITSSVDFVTGSTRFGSTGSNTHQFTGSVSITGSLTSNGALSGTSATFSSNVTINGAAASGMLSVQGNANSNAAFFVGNSTASQSYGLHIAAGTNATDYALRVTNQGQTTDLLKILGTGAATFSNYVTIGNSSTTPSILTLFPSTSAKGWQITANNYVASALEFTPATANGGTTFTTPAMLITTGGNVLIGTTSDGSGKLQVSGSNSSIIAQIKSPSGMLQLYPFFSAYSGPIIQALDGAGSSTVPLRIECSTVTVTGAATFASSVQATSLNANVGPLSDRVLYVSANMPTTGTNQYQGVINGTFVNAATNFYGLYLAAASNVNATNLYTLYLDSALGSGTVTNKYGIYQNGTERNYFAGNVGIGTTSPAEKLDVNGNILAGASSDGSGYKMRGVDGTVFRFADPTTTGGGSLNVNIGAVGTANGDFRVHATNVLFLSNGGSNERMRITSGGDVGIGDAGSSATRLTIKGSGATSSTNAIAVYNSSATTMFYIRNDNLIFAPAIYNNTNVNSANVWVNSDGSMYRSTASSLRYKDNIKDWDGNGLNTILSLKPKTFTYKPEHYKNPNLVMLGLIAEEVAEVSPYLAEYQNEDRTGLVENVRYANIVVPLIKAIQELKSENDSLKSRIEILENK